MADIIYSSVYKKLITLAPHLFRLRTSKTSKVAGFMDLHLDILKKEKDFIVIALSHYYKMNGDMVPDPDMEIKVYNNEMAEVLAYHDAFIYQRVYSQAGKVNLLLKEQLNQFLTA